eukprot:scaffold113895_cov32-Tisochrysis_lutea.AAC.1
MTRRSDSQSLASAGATPASATRNTSTCQGLSSAALSLRAPWHQPYSAHCCCVPMSSVPIPNRTCRLVGIAVRLERSAATAPLLLLGGASTRVGASASVHHSASACSHPHQWPRLAMSHCEYHAHRPADGAKETNAHRVHRSHRARHSRLAVWKGAGRRLQKALFWRSHSAPPSDACVRPQNPRCAGRPAGSAIDRPLVGSFPRAGPGFSGRVP